MIKKFAIFMAGLLLCLSILTSYKVEAEASAAVPIMGQAIYETFSTIFGYSMGWGKSTNGMSNGLTADSMATFANNELQGNSNYWNGIDVSGITNKQKFVLFLQNSLENLIKYNTGVEANELYDALNKRSYSASGTLATKAMEESIQEGLSDISSIPETEYESNMQNMLTSIVPGDNNISNYDVASSFFLFKLLQLGLIANSSYEASSEFYEDVTDSVYDYSSLYVYAFSFKEQTYRIYNMRKFEWIWGANKNILEFKDYVYFVPYLIGNQCLFFIIDDNAFEFEDHWYINDEFKSTTIRTSSAENGVYYNNSVGYVYTEGSNMFFEPLSAVDGNVLGEFYDYVKNLFRTEFIDKNYLDNAESITTTSPELDAALDDFWNKQITVEDVVDLSARLEALETAGTDTAIQDLTDTVNGLAVTLPDAVVDGKNDVVQAVEGVGEAILTLPKAIWLEFEATLEAIGTSAATATRPWEDGENKNNSLDITNIFNGVILLLLIVFVLLRIFLHCMIFIINVFRIPARPAFLPDEMVMGLEYLNTLEIPGMGLSVYAFMMGLIYILIMFYAIGVLRKSVDRIKLPKQ